MSNNTPPSSNSNTETPQEKIAKRVSTIVLIGTCVFGVLGITMAIVSMFTDKGDISKATNILQILFSAILPLFGTWIGTILAYYYSKENLEAANRTVAHLVDSITSDKKLESIKAKDIMIPLDKLKFKDYPTGINDTTINLKTDFLDYIKTNKISRVLLLDENKVAKYALHKSIIESFISSQYFEQQATAAAGGAAPTALQALTFDDLKKKGDQKIQAILNNGVKFIPENANLAAAKMLMQNFSECNDVFITKNGSANEPVLGWITDKTIAENSVV